MTSLTCNVTSCSANKDGGCCLHTITVEGPAAKKPSETVCGSFHPHDGAHNSACHNRITPVMEVSCSASECSYNENHLCVSEKICIDRNCGCGERSECSTFKI